MVAYSFKARFATPILNGRKRQTIRRVGRRRHARPGDALQLYTGMRTKQCRKIADVACESVHSVRLKWGENRSLRVWIDGKDLSRADRRRFVRADGFADELDMWNFWQKNHPGVDDFEGVLIKW